MENSNIQMGNIVLEEGIVINDLVTKGSVLCLNEDFMEESEPGNNELKPIDFFGQPIQSFKELEQKLVKVDQQGFVKKKILEVGGGVELGDGCTVSVAYSGYWEDEPEPFDVTTTHKPLVVDLKDNGLLPGLNTAVRSMLVGELSIFLFTYNVMYGEYGSPPRIKPKADCVFFIKLVRSIITTKRQINYSEPNMFQKVHYEAKQEFAWGETLYKNSNSSAAIQHFKKAIMMLHKCRLANENEEKTQESMLIKLYTNLAICYIKTKQPLRACTACNEVNRLKNIWHGNGKVLYHNARALRMIGDYDRAEKSLRRAMQLSPKRQEMEEELQLIQKIRNECNQSTLVMSGRSAEIVSKEFKETVDTLIRNFKINDDLCKLTLPAGMGPAEVDYVKEVCNRENVFCTKLRQELALDKDDQTNPVDKMDEL